MSLIIFGAGGFAPSVFDIATRMAAAGTTSVQPLGFLDDQADKRDRIERLGAPLLGSISDPPRVPGATHYAISVAEPKARRSISAVADSMGLLPAKLIHPSATFCPQTYISPGAIICAGTHFDSFVEVGRHAIINKNSIIGHDSTLGSFVTVSPMTVIGGASEIRDGVMIGMTATINPKTVIGSGAYIASGSAVTSDVTPNALMAGVPAVKKKDLEKWEVE